MSIGTVPLMPPLPEYERQTDSSDTRARGGGAERKVMSPEQATALAGLDQSTADQIAGTEEVRKHKEAENAIASDLAGKQAKAAEQHELLTGQAIDQGSKLLAAARARAQETQAKYDAAPPAKFMHDGDTWGNALRGVALMLTGAGDAMQKAAAIRTSGSAPATHGWQDLIESDLNEQKANQQRLSDAAVRAKTGVADATEARRQALADIDLRGASVYKRLEAVAKARLSALGMKAPEIEQNQAILALKAARAQKQADYVAPTWQSIHSTWENTHKAGVEETHRVPTAAGGGKPTERQQTDAFLGKNLNDQLDIIEASPTLSQGALSKAQSQELEMQAADNTASGGVIGNLAVRGARAAGLVTKSQTEGLSPDEQKVVTAYNVAKEMVARKLSGGAIVSDEDRQNAEKYMEHAGDSPELRAQKRQMLRSMAKDMTALAGQAGQTIQQGGVAPSGAHNPAPAGSTPAPATEPPPFKSEPAPASPRDKVIQLLKADPNRPGAAAVMKRFNITPEELQGG